MGLVIFNSSRAFEGYRRQVRELEHANSLYAEEVMRLRSVADYAATSGTGYPRLSDRKGMVDTTRTYTGRSSSSSSSDDGISTIAVAAAAFEIGSSPSDSSSSSSSDFSGGGGDSGGGGASGDF